MRLGQFVKAEDRLDQILHGEEVLRVDVFRKFVGREETEADVAERPREALLRTGAGLLENGDDALEI